MVPFPRATDIGTLVSMCGFYISLVLSQINSIAFPFITARNGENCIFLTSRVLSVDPPSN
jgi:hypothetical protein